MAKRLKFSNLSSFAKDVLDLPEYDIWLIDMKNELISYIITSRKHLGISQSELAEMVGTTQSVISRVESGLNKSVTLDYLMRIATALGISLNITLKEVA